MSRPRVLVVDDEEQMRAIVAFALETQGLEPVPAADAATAWHLFRTRAVDLVVLDVMLPDGSGVDLCRRIRALAPTPVILLTALSDVEDRVAGLEAGADDYVVKPFSPRELALRAQAILRRVAAAPRADPLVLGPLALDPASASASWAGTPIPLSAAELDFLVRLAREPGDVVALRSLVRDVWQTDHTEGARDMVKSLVYRLRGQLRAAGAPADLVESVRGQGYRLRPPG